MDLGFIQKKTFIFKEIFELKRPVKTTTFNLLRPKDLVIKLSDTMKRLLTCLLLVLGLGLVFISKSYSADIKFIKCKLFQGETEYYKTFEVEVVESTEKSE